MVRIMKPVYRKYLTTTALVWAGCFVLFFLAYMLMLAPQKTSRKQIEKQLAEKKQIYNTVLETAQEETRTRLNEQIEHLRNELSNFAVDFEDAANLTFDISQIASERGVGSFKIRTKGSYGGSPLPDCSYICENRVDVSFTAGFNQFAAFLNALERHRPVVFVDKFTITRSERANEAHQVNMGLAVFVRKRQSDSG